MKIGRKNSGGKYRANRKKRLYEKKSQERIVSLRETKRKSIRTRGGNKKTILLSSNIANVLNQKTKKIQKVKIKNVIETPQNIFLARQNRLLKSAVIETEIGRARITNRPSREGHVNAILIENKD